MEDKFGQDYKSSQHSGMWFLASDELFGQNEPKSLPPNTFSGTKTSKILLRPGLCPRSLLGELTTLPRVP